MEFSGFSEKTLPFLEAIRKNNNKEWFEAHRDEYEQYILNPSKAFVVEMGEHLMALEPTINFEPKINKSLFKIYRDIRRMGANKEPIKSKIGIIFTQGNSGSRLQNSSFYLHFSPDELFVSAGVRWFEKPMLDAYREYIKEASRREKLSNVLERLNAKGYKTIEKGYKKYPRGFSADMPSVDLSLYKG
ncbi:MAG: TIGR02453 family protein, partial [Sulfurimonas sp. RIFCSPLOWO2_12_FULL_36_74]